MLDVPILGPTNMTDSTGVGSSKRQPRFKPSPISGAMTRWRLATKRRLPLSRVSLGRWRIKPGGR